MCRDLCLAIQDGDLERAKELLDNGSSVHEEYGRWTPLQFAHESVEMTRLLLDRGASITSTDVTKTAFHIASENGCFEVVRLYLNRGAEVDMFGQYGSPLFYASKRGRLRVARLLLGRGADVNLILDWEVGGPLHVACSEGHFDMVKLLVARGADENASSNGRGGTPLSWVCESGNAEIARLLMERGAKMEDNILLSLGGNDENDLDLLRLFLDHGADPDVTCDQGLTPLIRASSGGQVDTVRLLLDRGCRVDGNDGEEGARPLHTACCSCKVAVARLLIDQGADLNAIDGDGQSPMHAAIFCETDQSSELVRLLLDNGAAVDTKTRRGNETALHIASRYDEVEIVQMLLDRGANVMARDEHGDTPLHGACVEGGLEIVHLLLDRGATSAVNVANGNGQIPLHLVCCNEFDDHLRIVRLLLDRGSNVNAKDKQLRTPLHLICEAHFTDNDHEFLELVRLLLDKGADVEAKTSDGLTPMHVACQIDKWEFVWLLVRRSPWLVLSQSCPSDERKKKRLRLC